MTYRSFPGSLGRQCLPRIASAFYGMNVPNGTLLDIRCWLPAAPPVAVATEGELDAERFFSFIGKSFIPHFGQAPV